MRNYENDITRKSENPYTDQGERINIEDNCMCKWLTILLSSAAEENDWDKLEQRWSKPQKRQLEEGLQAAR